MGYLDEVEARRVQGVKRELDASVDDDRRQGRSYKKCLVCDNACGKAQALCRACQAEFGDSPRWPAWLLFLQATEQRERRYFKKRDIEDVYDWEVLENSRPASDPVTPVEWEHPDFGHGTESGYAKGCRCWHCTRRASAARQHRRVSE